MVCPLFLTIRHQTTYPMLDTASSTSMGPWATSDPFLSPSVEPIEVWLGPISPLPMLAFLADIPWCCLEAVYQEYPLGKASQTKNTSYVVVKTSHDFQLMIVCLSSGPPILNNQTNNHKDSHRPPVLVEYVCTNCVFRPVTMEEVCSSEPVWGLVPVHDQIVNDLILSQRGRCLINFFDVNHCFPLIFIFNVRMEFWRFNLISAIPINV